MQKHFVNRRNLHYLCRVIEGRLSEVAKAKKRKMKSKKVCILTQPLWNNYGALLQAWALQRVIEQAGFEVVTDLFPKRFNSFWFNACDTAKRSMAHYLLGRRSVNPFPRRESRKEWNEISEHTSRFVKNNIKTVDFFEGNIKPRQEIVECFDTFVVGSDQVWRRDYGRVESYFCDFDSANRAKKIAYAASFGLSKWQYNEQETERLRLLAKRFAALSVRESDAVELCEKYLDTKATNVLDPTLLLTSKDYIELIEKNKAVLPQGGMMTYLLDKTPRKLALQKQLEDKLQLKSFSVMPERVLGKDTRHFDNRCVYPAVEKWIEGFWKADFVLTDSFHGTIFAIIFHKPFVVVANPDRGLSRFVSLLSLYGLENRLVSEQSDISFDILQQPIDYAATENKLSEERERSLQFLIGNLEQ